METFHLPTRIISGRGCVREHAARFAQLGNRALLVTGRNSATASGALRDVEEALSSQGIPLSVFDQVESNPAAVTVRAAAAEARRVRADLVIGIGGGSPLDAAKAASVLAVNDLSDDELFAGVFPVRPLPVAAVPTTAGTGSEVTPYAMLTNDAVRSKSFVISEDIIPRTAFLDAAYTESLPLQTTRHTALDALSHAVEGYCSRRSTALSSSIALESIRVLGECLPRLLEKRPPDAATRDRLLHASLLAGIVIAQTGTTALHALGYSLTYFRKIDHGRANALLMDAYLSYLMLGNGPAVMTVLRSLGIRTLEELRVLLDGLLEGRERITAEEAGAFASIASRARNIPCTLTVPSREDLERMLMAGMA